MYKVVSRQPCQDSEADTYIIGYSRTLVGRYASVRRRCAQTARISLHKTTVSKSDPQTKFHEAPVSQRIPARLVFSFSGAYLGFRRRPFPSPSRFRFGERVFTETRSDPQEGKTQSRKKTLRLPKTPRNLGVGARLDTRDPLCVQLSCPARGAIPALSTDSRPSPGPWRGLWDQPDPKNTNSQGCIGQLVKRPDLYQQQKM